MATHTHDDGFHEIQLNGKQLVFLFMAATVTSVVIFLCGVMVGRSVRAARVAAVEAQEIDQSPTADAAAKVTPPPDATEDVRVNPGTPPPSPVDDTSAREAESPRPSAAPAETPVPAAANTVTREPAREPVREAAAAPARPAPPAPAPAVAPAAAPAPAANSSKPADAAPVPTAAPGSGYTVQVAALNVRSEAEAIAKRLSAKGYAAYVQTPPGAKNVFRVRVGAYKTRREADAVASRLQKEEQFKPWVTR